MSAAKWWLPAATGIAGLAAGFLIGNRGQPDAPLERTVVASAQPANAGALTAEDVRSVLREELARQSASSSTPTALTPAPTEPPEATPAEREAASEAEAILAGAVSRSAWLDADADALKQIFDDMSPDQQAETLRQFAVALNQGRLKPQTERIPF
jgi:4-amino-4-deoxy-L-arabinose transferase-like glycosyltransferase